MAGTEDQQVAGDLQQPRRFEYADWTWTPNASKYYQASYQSKIVNVTVTPFGARLSTDPNGYPCDFQWVDDHGPSYNVGNLIVRVHAPLVVANPTHPIPRLVTPAVPLQMGNPLQFRVGGQVTQSGESTVLLTLLLRDDPSINITELPSGVAPVAWAVGDVKGGIPSFANMTCTPQPDLVTEARAAASQQTTLGWVLSIVALVVVVLLVVGFFYLLNGIRPVTYTPNVVASALVYTGNR